MLDVAGAPAAAAETSAWVLFAGGAVVFAVVLATLAWALARRGRDPGATASRRLVVCGGLVLPGVALVALAAWEVRSDGLDAGPPPLAVGVTGHLWWWQVRYRDPASGREFSLANELRLPAGRMAQVGVTTGDVIHSLWVPALAGKVDAIPGRVQQLRVKPARPGRYQGPCAEFCGEQHARMALDVVVDPPAAFEAWLRREAMPQAVPADPLAARGQALFGAVGCASCHVVRGLHERASGVAPDLTHVGARRTIGAGALAADRAGFARWIADVQGVKPGARMPSYGHLGEDDRAALAAFLDALE